MFWTFTAFQIKYWHNPMQTQLSSMYKLACFLHNFLLLLFPEIMWMPRIDAYSPQLISN